MMMSFNWSCRNKNQSLWLCKITNCVGRIKKRNKNQSLWLCKITVWVGSKKKKEQKS